MEANNNLRHYAFDNINTMELASKNLVNSALTVYLRDSNEEAVLLKIKFDNDRRVISSDTLKRYNISSSSPSQIKRAIDDAKQLCPANSYGLILWSHATSWAPPVSKRIQPFSFGEDQNHQMDIMELSKAIPENLEYLIFDACNMASLEVLWEFKDKAKYIIASPTEVLATGMPYDKILPFLSLKTPNLEEVSKQYFNYYNSFTGQMQSATVSLIDTEELETLSLLCSNLYRENPLQEIVTRDNVQRLDYTLDFPVPTFDFLSYLEQNFSQESLIPIKQQLEKIVVYKNATKNFLDKPVVSFSGLTCYIPTANDSNLEYYRRLTWYKESGLNILY